MIDVILEELNDRFTENNDILLTICKATKMNFENLKPLEELGIELPPEHELNTAKVFIETKKNEINENEQFNLLATLYEYRGVLSRVYNLFAIIETFGCSSAICEASFSALTRIDIPSRVCMSSERIRGLSFLAFEHKRLKEISSEVILKKFNDRKNRRVQLF